MSVNGATIFPTTFCPRKTLKMSHSTPTGPDRDRQTGVFDTPPTQSPLTPRTDQGVALGRPAYPGPNFLPSSYMDLPYRDRAGFPSILEDYSKGLLEERLAIHSPDASRVDDLPQLAPIGTRLGGRHAAPGPPRVPEPHQGLPSSPYVHAPVPYHLHMPSQTSDGIPNVLGAQPPPPLRSVPQVNHPLPQTPFLVGQTTLETPPAPTGVPQPILTPRVSMDEMSQHQLVQCFLRRMAELDARAPPPALRPPPGFQLPPVPQRPATGFRPMAALEPSGRPPSIAESERGLMPVNSPAFSNNYHGEHSIRNASVESLGPEENCALWLTNLPPDVTHHELLSAIRKVGRIWCTVINEPDYERHTTAAAKVVFFTPGPAQSLLTQSLAQRLRVRDHAVRVMHNRVKYRESPVAGGASRVLLITGKSDFVNEASLTEFFKKRFLFEVDEVISLASKLGRSVVEFRFGSYRCQAQMGKMALEKDRPQGFEKVEFGEDPCEVGDSFDSLDLAMRRIKGQYD